MSRCLRSILIFAEAFALLFSGPVETIAQVSPNSSHPTPEAIWKGIKSIAQDEVSHNSPFINFPEFDLKQVGSSMQLTVVKGGVEHLQFGNDPYELPFKKQILVESLRRALTEAQLGESKNSGKVVNAVVDYKFDQSWQQYLARAENLIKQMVVQIESENNRDKLDAKLRALEDAIDEILYAKIYSLIDQFAESRNYNVIYGRGGDEVKKFLVSITTIPEGARVFIMTELLYRKQLLMKTDPSQWPWIEIVQNPYELLGKYHYLTVWAGGKKVEGNIDVANGSPIKFQQH